MGNLRRVLSLHARKTERIRFRGVHSPRRGGGERERGWIVLSLRIREDNTTTVELSVWDLSFDFLRMNLTNHGL